MIVGGCDINVPGYDGLAMDRVSSAQTTGPRQDFGEQPFEARTGMHHDEDGSRKVGRQRCRQVLQRVERARRPPDHDDIAEIHTRLPSGLEAVLVTSRRTIKGPIGSALDPSFDSSVHECLTRRKT